MSGNRAYYISRPAVFQQKGYITPTNQPTNRARKFPIIHILLHKFSRKNYPADFIHKDRQPNRQQEVNDGIVVLPYDKGFSERVAKVLRGFNIKVAYEPIRIISNILKKPKGKIEKEASRGIVYKIKCKDGDCVYNGQTLRALKNMVERALKGNSNIE